MLQSRHNRYRRPVHMTDTPDITEALLAFATVAIVSLGLMVYLFWTLIRPESF